MPNSALGQDQSGEQLPQVQYQDAYNPDQTIQGGLVLQAGNLALIKGLRKCPVVRRVDGQGNFVPLPKKNKDG